MTGSPWRVGLVGLEHETNTFREGRTGLDDFVVLRGSEIERERGRRTYAAGMLDGIAAIGATAVPLVIAGAQPSGVIARGAYEAIRDEIVAAIRDARVDAVACQLHGAGVVEGIDDLEADLGRTIRAAVGPDVPVVGSLDLHANLTPATLEPYDALSCVRYYPHVDMYERGRESVEWLAHRLAGQRLETAVVPLPWLLLPTATTVEGPARAIALCDAVESHPGVLDATFVHGFPLADGPQVGCSVLVTTIAGVADASATARALAADIWRLRGLCHVEMFDVRDAVAVAKDEAATAAAAGDLRPVVLAETSDNPGGGGVGDGTHLLRALIDADVTAVFASIVDPLVAVAAREAGIGARVRVALGGRLDPSSGTPVEAVAEVLAVGDGRYTVRGVGWEVDLGASALVRIGPVDVVVTSGNQQVFDDGPFTIHGVDVRARRIVALKSANHFRAYYERIARRVVPVLGPGLSHQASTLPWERVRRPIWPIDDLPDDLPDDVTSVVS